ncbi:MAG: fimbria/pilus periplasmic chaperone [Burkholderiales bacterium]|nr:fimbria/pilus periplasmic chaperone [Burkholderiales bacterium]
MICATLVASGAATAGSFQVSPVRIELTPTAPTAAITVRNESATEAVVIQSRPVNWTQQDGKDVYVPSTALIATPPIFTLQPGATQTVRVGLRKAEPGDIQQTFRIYLTEVPPPPKPGFQGLQVSLNIGIPIFIAPKTRTGGEPVWRAMVGADGRLEVSATNPANTHVQVLEFNLQDGGDSPVATTQEPRYILAGQTVTWRLPTTRAPATSLRVKGRTDSGDVDAAVSLGSSTTVR